MTKVEVKQPKVVQVDIDKNTLSFQPWGNLSGTAKFYLSIFFALMVVAEASFLYIQAGEIFVNKSAKDVSTTAFALLLATNFVWIVYAVMVIGSFPVLLSGVLYVVGTAIILVGVTMYGTGDSSTPAPRRWLF